MILFVKDTGRDRRKKQITLVLRIHQVSIEIRTNYLKYILTLSFLFNNANLNFPCYLPQYQLYYCRYSAYSRFYKVSTQLPIHLFCPPRSFLLVLSSYLYPATPEFLPVVAKDLISKFPQMAIQF